MPQPRGQHPSRPPAREAHRPVPPFPRSPVRRWLRIGPGIIVALVLSVVVIVLQRRMQQAPAGPPIVERQVQPSAHPGAGTYPEVQFLLGRKDRLGLTPGQVAKLEQIQKEWDAATAPDRRALDQATREMNGYLQDSQKRGGTSMAEVQQRGAAVSALSGTVAASRYQAWQQALSVLSQGQRARAEAMRKAEARPGRER